MRTEPRRCTHDERRHSCTQCRHARFAPGVPSGRKQLANFSGHFTYHPKHGRVRGGESRSAFRGMAQVSGPITFGPRAFLAAAQSTNKYLSAPGLTVRWLT